jgi:hypothetical protein
MNEQTTLLASKSSFSEKDKNLGRNPEMESDLKTKVEEEIRFAEKRLKNDYIRSVWIMRASLGMEYTQDLKKAKFLYHGTNSYYLKGIKEAKALLPPKEHGNESNFTQSLNSAIYLTTSITRAIFWSKLLKEVKKGRAIVLKIPKEAVIGKIRRDRNLIWDQTSFQAENTEIRDFEVIEEGHFWNEIRKACGFENGFSLKDYVKIRYAIERNRGIIPQFEEIPESFKDEIGFSSLK